MNETNPHESFVQSFFETYGCSIIDKAKGHFTVQLTSEMDEEIMNRPFYWHYMKKMNRDGDPMQLTFTDTNHTEKEGIYLHAGTPKLHSLYHTAIKKGKTARLYEVIDTPGTNRAMSPWLILNLQLQYRGKQAKDEPLSIGINLIHGTLMVGMMERIMPLRFESTVSDYTFPMTPVISLKNAYVRIQKHLEQHIQARTNKWAEESILEWNKERELLETFYQSEDIDLDSFTREREQLDIRYKPRIEWDVINGGLFYLSQNTSAEWLTKR
ncbi:UNVERIFIED_CONTAM: hypothetical protein N8J90_12855 [Halobacillus marinus]|uniref:YqhG family protein n=1 Tax=Bacillaceae TaxID=186817 RepID=UPI0002A4FE6E|nr:MULTISPECIES: YqhG family protein [Bacillaceae]ELK46238.1 hypothetical protein D479_11516 [Halobacillus sp. BAB-2008]QHT47145.1 hypothetical protein M662_11785 [Bacillus sp. SB49]